MPGGYEQAKDEFFKEARIFRLMQHPNLVQVHGCYFSYYKGNSDTNYKNK